MRRHRITFTLSLAIAVSLAGCSLFGPRTAQDVVARSVKAHGGDALTLWQTLTIAGTIVSFGSGLPNGYGIVVTLPTPGGIGVLALAPIATRRRRGTRSPVPCR